MIYTKFQKCAIKIGYITIHKQAMNLIAFVSKK